MNVAWKKKQFCTELKASSVCMVRRTTVEHALQLPGHTPWNVVGKFRDFRATMK